jgi:ribonuclease HI
LKKQNQQNQQIEEILQTAEKLKLVENIQVHIHWIRGHFKNFRNEIANKIAKKIANSEMRPESNRISITHIKKNINVTALIKWTEKWQKSKKRTTLSTIRSTTIRKTN